MDNSSAAFLLWGGTVWYYVKYGMAVYPPKYLKNVSPQQFGWAIGNFVISDSDRCSVFVFLPMNLICRE